MHQKADRRKPFCFAALVLSVLVFAVPTPATSRNHPELLQERAIKRIEGFIDHFRRTGEAGLVGELQQAEAELAASYRAFALAGNLPSAALSLIKLADIQRMQNRWLQAIELYQEAHRLARTAGHPAYQAKALMGRARAELYGTKHLGAAAAHIEEALRLSEGLDDKSDLFDALDYQAQLRVSSGDLVAAADALTRAFSLAGELKDRTRLFFGHLDRAEVYQKLAEKCDYQRAFKPCYQALELAKADYEEARALATELGYHGLARQADGFLQRLETRRALIQSQERFHEALVQQRIFHPNTPGDVLVQEQYIAGSQHIPPGLAGLIQHAGFGGAGDARSFYIRGLFHEMQGENDAALAAYLKAVDLLEIDRRNLRDEKSRGTFLEDKIDFYYTPILHLLERRRFSDAFELSERSRSRAMADLLTSKKLALSRPGDQQLYGQSVQLRAEIALRQKQLFDLRSGGGADKHARTIAKANAEIDKLEREHRELLARMAEDAPRLQELLASEPVSLEQLQDSMAQDGSEVLQYLVLESAVILWHISGDAIHVRSVFLPRSEVIKKVARLRGSLVDRNVTFDEATARELFLFLIQPALRWIRTDHLIIIPHEDLNYIPFQVLQNPSNNRFLGERFQISYAPSATVLLRLARAGHIAGATLLAAADPEIADARDEVAAIAALYPNRNKVVKDVLVKEADLKAWAGEYTILHLAVHGLFNPGEPLLSYLALRKAGQDDGRLTAAEMFGLPLDGARLVVLSACETGQAEATHANEILGMVRGLLYAGANTLVLSSWTVETASTALWMETFYREAQTQPLSEAARLALVTVKERAEYAHPYFWGAFLMIGK